LFRRCRRIFGGHRSALMQDTLEIALRIPMEGTDGAMSPSSIIMGVCEIEKLLKLNH